MDNLGWLKPKTGYSVNGYLGSEPVWFPSRFWGKTVIDTDIEKHGIYKNPVEFNKISERE